MLKGDFLMVFDPVNIAGFAFGVCHEMELEKGITEQ